MIVQLIVIKCVQICEAIWAESRTQSTTPIRDGWTHGHEYYVPRSGHSPRGGQKLHSTPHDMVHIPAKFREIQQCGGR